MNFKMSVLLILILDSICINSSDQQYSPENTKFMWDLHGVIVKYDSIEIAQQIWQLKINLLSLVHPFNLYQGIKALCSRATDGEWGAIVENDPYLADSIICIGNSVKPIEETVQIMQRLQQLGYEQDLASDINTQFLHVLEQKPLMQPVFQMLTNKKSVDSAKPQAIYKYDNRYFIDYQNSYNQHNKQLIFIDDWQTNIISAQTVGIKSILFRNPEQLNKELEELGIFKKS